VSEKIVEFLKEERKKMIDKVLELSPLLDNDNKDLVDIIASEIEHELIFIRKWSIHIETHQQP